MSSPHIERLIIGITRILMKEAGRNRWTGGDEKVEHLARAIVESWLMPEKYFKLSLANKPIVKVFALTMQTSTERWRESWESRYDDYKHLPDDLYRQGFYQQTGAVAGGN